MKATFFIIISAIIIGFFIGRFFVPTNIVDLEENNINIAVATIAIDTQDSELKVFRDIFVSPDETMLSVLERLAEQEVIDFEKIDSGFVLENKKATDNRNWIMYQDGERLLNGIDSLVEPGHFFELQYEATTSTAELLPIE